MKNSKFSLKRIFYLILKKFCFNEHFIIFIFFIIWMIFFDIHSVLNHYELSKQIREFEIENMELQRKIDKSRHTYNLLKENKSEKERYARENYFMKKPNEDIIIVTYKEDSIPSVK